MRAFPPPPPAPEAPPTLRGLKKLAQKERFRCIFVVEERSKAKESRALSRCACPLGFLGRGPVAVQLLAQDTLHSLQHSPFKAPPAHANADCWGVHYIDLIRARQRSGDCVDPFLSGGSRTELHIKQLP